MNQAQPLRPSGRYVTWLVAAIVAMVAAGLAMAWLDRAYAPGAGWLWLTGTVALGGVGVQLAQRRRQAVACSIRPRVQPLQVSCLALQALGVLLFRSAAAPAFQAALPPLTAPWLPLACITGGVAGLGIISLFCDCRDAALHDG